MNQNHARGFAILMLLLVGNYIIYQGNIALFMTWMAGFWIGLLFVRVLDWMNARLAE